MSDQTERYLLSARVVWLAVLISGLVLSGAGYFLARSQGASLLNWNGFLDWPLPVARSVLLPAVGVAVMVLLVVWHLLIGGPPAAVEGGEGPGEPALREWFRRQVLFAAFADMLVALAFVSALLLGTVLLLWMVSVETAVVLLFYLPSSDDLEPTQF
ncbi:MAG: hypothetical protein R6X33_19545 [Candidatus Brocadiia bacterium]